MSSRNFGTIIATHSQSREPTDMAVVPTLSLVIPHWPLNEETNEALRRGVSSFSPESA